MYMSVHDPPRNEHPFKQPWKERTSIMPNAIGDYHMHTVFSDGSSEPEALLEAVAAQGVKTVAVTDHDTTAGYERLIPQAEALGLNLIRSIEINTHWGDEDLHVLGYYIDDSCDYIRSVMEEHQKRRRVQIQAMVERIQKHTNIPISVDDVFNLSHPQGAIGRPHVAKMLVEKKAARNMSDAFNRFLKSNCTTYVNRETVAPHEAVEAIYESGGIPVIAHPGLTEGIEKLIPELVGYGLMGLEAYHKGHSPALIEYFCCLAEEHELIVTGGTDYHGLPDMYAQAHQRLIMPNHVHERLEQAFRSRSQAKVSIQFQ
jgi:3',5'-nucleoside bisphosphate phosphatase